MENKTARGLVIILIVTLFITTLGSINTLSKIGGFKALTGAWSANDTTVYGAVNLTIQQNAIINFSDDTANFGTGYVGSGASSCTIGTDGTNASGCVGFSIPNGLILENTGNRLVSIKISNTNYTSSLLYDTEGKSGYAWKFENTSAATCIGGNFTAGATEGPWGVYHNITAVYSPSVNWTLCDIFNFTADNDKINLSLKLHITPSTRSGDDKPLSDTWTVTAVDAS